ncbi:MAG: cell division protein FtsB [Proteobacteria bacterium]|nr:cell division protein FtsB [Pseudomonadota bacterium]
MIRWVALILVVLLIALQLKLWLGEGGMRDLDALRARVAAQETENAQLKKRNEALSAEVQDLKHGQQAIEARARSELGLIKPGETFYQVVTPAPAASASTTAADDSDGH